MYINKLQYLRFFTYAKSHRKGGTCKKKIKQATRRPRYCLSSSKVLFHSSISSLSIMHGTILNHYLSSLFPKVRIPFYISSSHSLYALTACHLLFFQKHNLLIHPYISMSISQNVPNEVCFIYTPYLWGRIRYVSPIYLTLMVSNVH